MMIHTHAALVREAFALAVVGTLLGYVQNAVRPDRVPMVLEPVAAACGAGEAPTSTQLVELDADAVRALLAEGAFALDVRPAEAFEAGHVLGAAHLPCAASSDDVVAALGLARSHTALVVYGGADDASTRPLAEELSLRLAGVRVVLARGGFDALLAAGAPAQSGPCGECLDHGGGE